MKNEQGIVRAQGFVRLDPQDPLPIAPADPAVWHINRLQVDEDGDPLMEGIFANYNDDIILEADSNTIVGRFDPARGPAQRLEIGEGLKVVDGRLIGEGSGGAVIADQPPADAKYQQTWFESDSGITWINYATSGPPVWVQVSGGVGAPGPVGPIGPQGVEGPAGASSSMWLYRFDTSTQAQDPGAGRLRYNSAVMANVTRIYFDRLTQDGLDPTIAFTIATFDDEFVIQERGMSAHNMTWKLTGPAIDRTDWFEVPVQFVSQVGANFSNNLQITVLLRTRGQQGPMGPSGPAGIQGAQGPKGDTGAQGPVGGTGPVGPQGRTGDTGAQGPQGIVGPIGSLWFSGAGNPDVVSGARNGDWYLDTTDGQVFERVANAWVYRSDLTGDTGPQGPKGDTGSPGPPGGLGEAPIDGNIYARQQANWAQTIAKSGDIMSGHLSLPTGPAAANAIRKDFADNAYQARDPQLFVGIPILNKTANYTLTLADAQKGVVMLSSTATFVTIPSNASVAFPVGAVVTVYNQGTNTTTLTASDATLSLAGKGTTANSNVVMAIGAIATMIKIDNTRWVVSGAGLT